MQALWMLFASFAFSLMGVAVKLASETYSTAEIVLYRGAVGMLMLGVFMRWQGVSLRTPYGWRHAWRGLVGVVSLWMWFYAISLLPLATAMTLNYMSPIWIAAILFGAAWWRRQRKFEWRLAAAILCSALGVVLLLRPSFHAEQAAAGLIALSSSLLAALAYLAVRDLGRMGEPETRVVFYFSVSGVVAGLCSSLAAPEVNLLHQHSLRGLGLLLAVGVLATLAQLAMTRAYRLGNTLVTANLQYTGIVFSSMWGILLWQDILSPLSWLGMAIIVASGLVATYYNTRNNPANKPASDPIATEP
ncbi:DMT family transporter [Massilia sp. W12]|uniref:DMT family transporter n=1 Tax=Massilia sp. W12 TaxID=3126507 RepID=UPI0030CAB3BA